MSRLSLDSRVVRRDHDLVQAPNGDVLYMMHLATGRYLYLNAVSTQIWAYIQTPTPVSEVCQKLEAEFAVSSAQSQKEVLAFLLQLEQNGQLEIQ